MAARGRGPRANLMKDDLADEVQLWHSIVDKIRRCGAIHKQYEDIAASIPETEDKYSEDDDRYAQLTNPYETAVNSLPVLETLSKLHRDGLKLADEELKILLDEPDTLISSLEILISVRSAFEAEVPTMSIGLGGSRSGVDRGGIVVAGNSIVLANSGTGPGGGGGPPGKRHLKRRLEAESTGTGAPGSAVESPAMTPEPVSATAMAGRLVGKGGSRSGSVGLGGASKSEVVFESADGSKISMHDKYIQLKVGTQVFLRNKNKASDGEGILCTVISVIGDGKNRRYEVQDPEPDETGAQPLPYKAVLSSLEPIPPPPASPMLPDLPKGKQVIAVYPDTSTFYKAEVVGKRGEWVRLRFEGEEERDKEQEVERRLVLDAK